MRVDKRAPGMSAAPLLFFRNLVIPFSAPMLSSQEFLHMLGVRELKRLT